MEQTEATERLAKYVNPAIMRDDISSPIMEQARLLYLDMLQANMAAHRAKGLGEAAGLLIELAKGDTHATIAALEVSGGTGIIYTPAPDEGLDMHDADPCPTCARPSGAGSVNGSTANECAGGVTPHRPPLSCFDCGLLYDDARWVEVTVEKRVWIQISPTGDEGGLLCFRCITKRLNRYVEQLEAGKDGEDG